MKNILTENKLVKNLRAYPVLHKRWCDYVKGVRELPEGFTAEKLFHDYLKVRRSNPEKRVSMSEYMIFGFYGLTTAQQKQYLTDVEATLLMRPYNSAAEPYLKSKVTFLKNFTQFVSRGWLYLPESDLAAFDAFVRRYHSIALKPQYSSWGIGFRKLTEAEWNAAPHRQALFDSYILHPMTGVRFRGTPIPQWEEICDFCRSAAQTLPCLRVVGWDVAILPGGKLELIEGNHNPGMNIVQAPAKHGVHDKFAHMLLDFYGDPAQYAYETVKQP